MVVCFNAFTRNNFFDKNMQLLLNFRLITVYLWLFIIYDVIFSLNAACLGFFDNYGRVER